MGTKRECKFQVGDVVYWENDHGQKRYRRVAAEFNERDRMSMKQIQADYKDPVPLHYLDRDGGEYSGFMPREKLVLVPGQVKLPEREWMLDPSWRSLFDNARDSHKKRKMIQIWDDPLCDPPPTPELTMADIRRMWAEEGIDRLGTVEHGVLMDEHDLREFRSRPMAKVEKLKWKLCGPTRLDEGRKEEEPCE
jgi:hypothetical protein